VSLVREFGSFGSWQDSFDIPPRLCCAAIGLLPHGARGDCSTGVGPRLVGSTGGRATRGDGDRVQRGDAAGVGVQDCCAGLDLWVKLPPRAFEDPDLWGLLIVCGGTHGGEGVSCGDERVVG